MHHNQPTCPICQNQASQLCFFSSSNADGRTREIIGLLNCLKCNTYFTDPLIYKNQTNFQEQYERGVYRSKKNILSSLIDGFLAIIIDIKINKIAAMVKPEVNLLDVGCGKGRFLSRVKKAGWAGLGLEPTKKQAEFGIDNYGIKVMTGNIADFMPDGQGFDVITSWHVLEHVDKPVEIISSIRNLLKDNGLLVIEVPNFMSLQSGIGKDKWFHLDMPRHIVHYTKTSITLLLESGFNIQKIETFSFELGPYGLLQTLLNLLNFSPNLFYRWLKGCQLSENRFEIILTIMLAAVLLLPSIVLEYFASLFKAGGAIRIYATKK